MDEHSILKQQEWADRGKMFLTSLLCVLPGFARGSMISYLSVSLSHYLDDKNTSGITMSQEQASWFVSLSLPMQMVGLLGFSWLPDRIGRKLALIASTALLVVGLLVLYVAPSYYFLLLGVTICGIASGTVNPPGYLLLSEISLIKYRGTLGSINTMTNNGGYLYGLIVGKTVPYTFLPLVSILPALIFLSLSWALVESPQWYAKQGRIDRAEKTLRWLRGPNYFLKPELKELESLTSGKSSAPLSLLMSRAFLIPLSITFLCFGIQIVTAMDIFSFYMLNLVKKSDLPIGDVAMAVLFQTFCTFAYMINPILMTKFKRRPIFLLNTSAIGFSLFTLGVLSYVGVDTLFLHIFTIGCLLVISSSYGLGTGPVGFSLVGELFPQELRSFGCSLALSSRYVFSFVDVKMFSLMEAPLGMGGVYFLHSGLVSVGVVLAFLFLPETKDLSFTELQQLYSKDTVQEKTQTTRNQCTTTRRRRTSVSCSS